MCIFFLLNLFCKQNTYRNKLSNVCLFVFCFASGHANKVLDLKSDIMGKVDNTRNIVIIVENGSLQNLDTHVKVRSLDNHTPRVKYRSCNIAELFIDKQLYYNSYLKERVFL